MTRLRLSDREIDDGVNLVKYGQPGNVWGQLGTLPGYQVGGVGPIVANPDLRPMLIKLSLPKPEFITIYTRSPLNDDILPGFAGFPYEEIVGHIQFGVGGYFCDADFDWIEGNRLTILAQSLQLTARRVNLLAPALPAANPGDYQVAAFAGIGAHGTSEITRTITVLTAAGIAPGVTFWAIPQPIPRLAKKLSVHLPIVNTTVNIQFLSRSLVTTGSVNINIPYTDSIVIPNGTKLIQGTNIGAINNTPACMTFVFGLAL